MDRIFTAAVSVLVCIAVSNVVTGYILNSETNRIRKENPDIFNDSASGQTINVN